MKARSRVSKEEKRLVGGALLVLLLCLALFFYGDRWFWGEGNLFNHHPRLGTISFHQNDARHKPAESLTWYAAKDRQVIREGDSVFSGSSSSTDVTLDGGGGLTVGENSMVVFRNVEDFKVADLQNGNFRLAVNGSLKLAVNGQVTTVEGKGSEVQIVLTGKTHKPMMKLLKGEAHVVQKTGRTIPVSRVLMTSISEPEVPRTREVVIDPFVAPLKPPAPPPPVVPMPIAVQEEWNYTWHLDDLYGKQGDSLLPRSEPPAQVSHPVALRWAVNPRQATTRIEHSGEATFKNPTHFETPQADFTLVQVYLGENFWRASYDGRDFTPPQKFTVRGEFWAAAAPRARISENPVPFFNRQARAVIHVGNDRENSGFVYQVAADEKFADARVFWTASGDVDLRFNKTGVYFYRFRAVSPQQEVSDWSETLPVDVAVPKRPPPPSLRLAKSEGVLGEPFGLAVSTGSSEGRIEILNQNGEVISRLEGKEATWAPAATGEYQARAFARNLYGQLSRPSEVLSFKILPKPIPPALVKREEKPTRAPTAATSSTSLSPPPSLRLNEAYKESQVSLQGILWAIQSSQQYYQDESSPAAVGLGVHAMHWMGSSGVEGSVKTGVLPANGAGSETSQLKDAEVRYHYRFLTDFPFGLAREFQISLFGGYEIYRNAGGLFSSRYDLFKIGTAMEFPVWRRWSSGGEFVYGISTDASSKKEISGNLNYFLSPRWSLGVGYRVHFFDAASAAAAPGGYLPYREGYTEGFSILNYKY